MNPTNPATRHHCSCAHCNCLRLREPALPPTAAEKLITETPPQISHSDIATQDAYWRTFGYAILNAATVEFLKKYSPIVEAGAGTGYWAWELQKAGLDVVPTDPSPEIRFPDATLWTNVLPLTGPQAAAARPGRNLLLCWPDREGEWPQRTLETFTGNRLIYVGEERNGCTGTPEMFNILDDTFTLERTHAIPRFRGNNDHLFIYIRNN